MTGYVYELFGVWWVFWESRAPGPIHMKGPYRTRDQAEAALQGEAGARTGPVTSVRTF
ncbi:MAG: hypothetical protein AMXMBFR4_09790 [Candidatus Hydrogenedentota bacterium]